MVVIAAIPRLPPVFLIRLKTPEAFPICSFANVPMAIVVNGTKMNPMANPLIMLGQTMLLDDTAG
jgi:hypothetical protein